MRRFRISILALFRRFRTPVLALLLACTVYLCFVNYTEPTVAGLAWNRISGETWIQDSGMHLSPPWVSVARMDTRPMRVCVTSTTRGFSCKLARFEPSAFKKFVEVEGFRYYWWANRISFNFSYNEEYRGQKDIMRGYAYSAIKYPFITILEVYEDQQ